MCRDIIAIVSGCVTIIGFVSIFIKIGIDKGDTSRRITHIEEKIESHLREFELTNKEVHGLQREWAGFMARIEANIDFIKQSISDLRKREEK